MSEHIEIEARFNKTIKATFLLLQKHLCNVTNVKRALWSVNYLSITMDDSLSIIHVNYPFTFCPGWMVTKASVRSKLYAPLSTRLYFFFLTVCKDFSLHTERKFTKTVNDNKLVIHQQDFFQKKRICKEWCAHAILQQSRHDSPAICEH